MANLEVLTFLNVGEPLPFEKLNEIIDEAKLAGATGVYLDHPAQVPHDYTPYMLKFYRHKTEDEVIAEKIKEMPNHQFAAIMQWITKQEGITLEISNKLFDGLQKIRKSDKP